MKKWLWYKTDAKTKKHHYASGVIEAPDAVTASSIITKEASAELWDALWEKLPNLIAWRKYGPKNVEHEPEVFIDFWEARGDTTECKTGG